jgi:hypothetical protein
MVLTCWDNRNGQWGKDLGDQLTNMDGIVGSLLELFYFLDAFFVHYSKIEQRFVY